MNVIERSALVPYSSEQMFNLVNDIEAYPQFMDGCVGAEILSTGDNWLEARLDLSVSGLAHSFVTRNTNVPSQSVHMSLVSGPFKTLEGDWGFIDLQESACKITFELRFEFSNILVAMAAGRRFENVANRQVDSLVERAKVVYG